MLRLSPKINRPLLCFVSFFGITLSGTSTSYGLIEIARGALFIDTSTSLVYTSNVFLNSGEEEDLFFSFTPTAIYMRNVGLVSWSLEGGTSLFRYNSRTEQNSEDFFLRFTGTYPNYPDAHPRLGGTLNLGYEEDSQPNEFLNNKFFTKRYEIGSHWRYRVSDKTGLFFGGSYNYNAYSDPRLNDVQMLMWTIGGYYSYSPKLDLNISYRGRRSLTKEVFQFPSGAPGEAMSFGADGQIQPTVPREKIDSQDHGISVGASGELTPKIAGSASIGVQGRYFDRDDLSDRYSLFSSISLSWAARPTTAVSAVLAHDFSTLPDNRSVETWQITGRLSQRLGQYFTAQCFLSYSEGYWHNLDRDDEEFSAGIGLARTVLTNGSVAINYSYTKRWSNLDFANYENIRISGTFRYRF